MVYDFYVRNCSKGCPHVRCRHECIKGVDALSLTYNYDKFVSDFWNYDLSHHHRVRHVLPQIDTAISKLENKIASVSEQCEQNPKSTNPEFQLLPDYRLFLKDLMMFKRILSPFPSALFISERTEQTVIPFVFVPFEDEMPGFNIHGIFDNTDDTLRDDESYPNYHYYNSKTKMVFIVDDFQKLWRVIEELVSEGDYAEINLWLVIIFDFMYFIFKI